MDKPAGLALLRQPFPPNQISKLPKGTKVQNECDYSQKRKCNICGSVHHPDIIHLDYVGHAALTDRLLDADSAWTWEPLSMSPDGLPVMDNMGGMWIKLTVCGVTRLGYGHAGAKTGGDAIKEVIGDALRNAAMRFGAALELWHKGELHEKQPMAEAEVARHIAMIDSAKNSGDMKRALATAIEDAGDDVIAVARFNAAAQAKVAAAKAKETT